MSNDLSIRGLVRIPDSAGSDTQSAEDKIQKNPVGNSQQAAATPKLQPEAANARRAEAGITANQLQSQLLNQTNKKISTGTTRATNQTPKSDGAALQKALKMYGITNEQLQRYVATGEEPEGLKKAISDARAKGGWPALNIVRASFQKRAEYLRANSSPDDNKSRAQADQLDAESASLTRNRHGVQLKQAKDRLELSKTSTRPANTQNQVTQATMDIENISAEMEKMIKPRK